VVVVLERALPTAGREEEEATEAMISDYWMLSKMSSTDEHWVSFEVKMG